MKDSPPQQLKIEPTLTPPRPLGSMHYFNNSFSSDVGRRASDHQLDSVILDGETFPRRVPVGELLAPKRQRDGLRLTRREVYAAEAFQLKVRSFDRGVQMPDVHLHAPLARARARVPHRHTDLDG